jgi:HK97 family phage major capsid protein
MSEVQDLKTKMDAIHKTVHDFQEKNDEILKKFGDVDPLDAKALDKMNDAITAAEKQAKDAADAIAKKDDEAKALESKMADLEAALNRPVSQDGEKAMTAEQVEHKAAFDKFMRKGAEENLKDLERKALSVGTDADGGYAVPEQVDTMIEKLLVDISPMRAVAGQVTVGTSDYKKLVNVGGIASGWVGETASRSETNTSQLSEVVPPIGEVYANPAATQTMLDDAMFDAEAWLASEVAEEVARAENAAFISGTGTAQPKGFLNETVATTADGTRAFGQIQYRATGVDGDWAASNEADALIDLVHDLRSGYRTGATWMMSNLTLASVRKLKDGDGNYLWRPGLADGQPATILGYNVAEAEDMPEIASDSLSIAFGNFRRGYLIVDRIGTRVLRDPFTNKPYVHFYTTKRVGGKTINSECIKLLKFGVS